jgi:hypothetical protein
MPAKANWCASTAADRAFTKCESETAASVLALLELSEDAGAFACLLCYSERRHCGRRGLAPELTYEGHAAP